MEEDATILRMVAIIQEAKPDEKNG